MTAVDTTRPAAAPAASATFPNYILTISCPDRMGIVAAMSRFLVDHGCDILDSAQFGDRSNGRFFLRTSFLSKQGVPLERLQKDFAPIAKDFEMEASLHDASQKTRTLIMVSRFGHCLNDLLYRCRIGALPIDIPAVVSNHRDFEDLVGSYHIPFRHMPVTKDNKAEQESALLKLIDDERIELVVLARYMQVLSPLVCRRLPGRVINIHHSFLPSFKGAAPYTQAHQRGVKLIGATSHYVTEDLDEGPIIEQAVERVSHAMSPEDLTALGRDVECLALSRAVKWHAEHRVLLDGRRSVVFN
ncbi:MAG TPA: formyltetrahydrofolate deformylase [Hyphomicrobiales bacterium]|nr:formyltetrahydrofolate deformylase [Hyphomicrobiales bacterium]